VALVDPKVIGAPIENEDDGVPGVLGG